MGAGQFVLHLLLLILAAGVPIQVTAAKFSYGQEAEKLCQAYRKVCPRGKVCAVQTLHWPRLVKFPVCVHKHVVKVRSPSCELAPSPGGCGAQFRRWYFNVHMAACSWFTYGGCGGNDNNFRSREECEMVCVTGRHAVTPTPTTHPGIQGHHRQSTPHHSHRPQSLVQPSRDAHSAARLQEGSRPQSTHHRAGVEPKLHQRTTHHRTGAATELHQRNTHGHHDIRPAQPRPTNPQQWPSRAMPEQRVYPSPHHKPSHHDRHNRHRHRDLAAVATTHDSGTSNLNSHYRRVANLAERRQPPTDVLESDRRVAEFSDKTKRLSNYMVHNRRDYSDKRFQVDPNHADSHKRLSDVAMHVPKITRVKFRRRKPSKPIRTLSLLSAPRSGGNELVEETNNNIRTPLVSAYAPAANETIRRLPTKPRRHKKKRRGRKGKKRRNHRRRKNRKRNRTNRRKWKKAKKPGRISNSWNGTNTEESASTRKLAVDSGRDGSLAPSAYRYVEFRQPQTQTWPDKTLNDQSGRKDRLPTTGSALRNKNSNRSSRRRERKRKRKGKRLHRQAKGKVNLRSDKGAANLRPQRTEAKDKGGNQYYDRIHLFGLLDRQDNATRSFS